MQASAANKARTDTASGPASVAPADPFSLSSNAASARVGDALLVLGAAAGPIDPIFRLLAQAEVAYSND